MKNKLLLGLATATILAVGSDALINTSINQPQVLLAAKTKKKHHKKRQAAKYRPRLLKKHPAYIIGQSSLPDAKSLINTGKLPKVRTTLGRRNQKSINLIHIHLEMPRSKSPILITA